MPGPKLPSTSVHEALELILEGITPTSPAKFPVEECLGKVLAEDIEASADHPSESISAMDGYAVRSVDLRGASEENPVDLELLEDLRAGFAPEKALAPGHASRISTGAILPEGADSVVMREITSRSGDRISFFKPCAVGDHIRVAGEHLKRGRVALGAGTLLQASHIGMAAFLGKERCRVFPGPKVAVLATGSELVSQAKKDLSRGQIRDSNSFALAAAVRSLGFEVTLRRAVPDEPESLDSALQEAFAGADVVLTSGGISAGWHDLVRERIERSGGVFQFHKLKMRPGKPLAFGRCAEKQFFCLPGNPVSSLVTFEIFVKPALLKLAARASRPTYRRLRLLEPIEKRKGFTIFFRGVEEGDGVRLTGPQGSHLLTSLNQANVLIRTEEEQERLEAGSLVEVLDYNREVS